MGMETQSPDVMGRRRALLTDSERDLLTADELEDENRRYQAVSRIRNKIEDELPRDIQILEENHEQLLAELRDVACPDQGQSDELREAVRDAREAYEDVDGNGVDEAIARLEELTGADDE